MKRIYLSGPMSGLPGLNFPTFHNMTSSLRASGHTVTNPAELNPDGGTWNDCMRRDIAALMDCDTVATLPGWEHSKGARLEVLIAERLGMTVVNAHDLVTREIACKERDALQQRLTAADEALDSTKAELAWQESDNAELRKRADVLEGLLRLARGAIGENQCTLLTKDIDAMLSQDAKQTNNSGNAHCPHDGICHTSEETCAEAQARIAFLTAPAGAGQ